MIFTHKFYAATWNSQCFHFLAGVSCYRVSVVLKILQIQFGLVDSLMDCGCSGVIFLGLCTCCDINSEFSFVHFVHPMAKSQ